QRRPSPQGKNPGGFLTGLFPNHERLDLRQFWVRWHPGINQEKLLDGDYGYVRAGMTLQTNMAGKATKPWGPAPGFLGRHIGEWRGRIETGYILDGYHGRPFFHAGRIHVEWSVTFRPRALDALGIFVGGYDGQDYYNMHFDRRLDIVRIGIT